MINIFSRFFCLIGFTWTHLGPLNGIPMVLMKLKKANKLKKLNQNKLIIINLRYNWSKKTKKLHLSPYNLN